MRLVLASGNPGKRREIEALLAPFGVEVVTAAELGFTEEVPETGATFEENATIKARAVAQALQLPALADDSGLEVEALGGAPGVHSARYAGPQAEDATNNQKLMEALQGIPLAQRGAAFVCVMVCIRPDGEMISSRGRLPGRITLHPRGRQGFGYDPLFELPQVGMTVAQLRPEEKNAISHRSQALAQLIPRLPGFLSGENPGNEVS